MSDSIEKFRKRRDERMGKAVEMDAVMAYRKRRQKRIDQRHFDSNIKRLYGIAIGMGISGAAEMSPPELIKALQGEGVNIQKAIREGGNRRGSMKPNSSGYVGGWKPPKVSGMDRGEVNKVLSTCNHIGQGHYGKASKVANAPDKQFLWTFTTHGRDHVQQVIDKTNQAADAIDKMPEDSVFRGAKVDRKTMLVSAWFHYTGLDGDSRDWSGDNGIGVRDAHGTESALHILEHANEIKKLGVDPNKAAMIAFSHTKSKSGVLDLSKPEDWNTGLTKLKAAAEMRGIEFDADSVFGGKPNEDNIHEMAAQVAALRLGDANREAKGNDLLSQSGGKYEIDRHPDMEAVQKMIDKGEVKNPWEAEVANSQISITDKEGQHILSDDDPKMSQVSGWRISARVVLGERNMDVVDTRYNPKHEDLQVDVSLKNGNDVPWCTTEALLERCGELNTINGVPRAMTVYMNGVENEGAMNKTSKAAYRDMWRRICEDRDKSGNLKFGGVSGLILVYDDGSKLVYDSNKGNLEGRRK